MRSLSDFFCLKGLSTITKLLSFRQPQILFFPIFGKTHSFDINFAVFFEKPSKSFLKNVIRVNSIEQKLDNAKH